jgi:arylsulfatase A-like enzyme
MKPHSENIYRGALLGALMGAAVWSAYCVAEFGGSSLLFRVVRPYATFTAEHWRLTSLLSATYLVLGALVGAVAGIAVQILLKVTRFIQNADTVIVVQAAATLTVVVAFGAQVLAGPSGMPGKNALFGLCAGMAVLLLATMRSAKWSERFGYLTHPWVAIGLLLGAGQEVSLLVTQVLARQLGTRVWLISALIIGSLISVALAAALLPRFRPRRRGTVPFSFLTFQGTAFGLTLILMIVSAWLGRASPVEYDGPSSVAASSTRPNILIIVMDTVRADHLSVYEYERDTTPNLKLLARDSALYSRAIAPSDMTLTSHASLFTGVYPSWHGAYCDPPDASYGRELTVGIPTLAGLLSDKGYVTLGASANLYLRADFGLQRGFQAFRIPRPVPVLGGDENWYLIRVGLRRVLQSFLDTSQFDRVFSLGQNITQEFWSLVDGQNAHGAPFFAFLNYMDAHFPYIPPAPFDRLFPGKDDRLVQQNLDAIYGQVVRGQPMPASVLRHSLAQYDGGIAYIDAQIGQLLEWLKRRDLYDNTLIVIAGDHGEAFGERHLVLHGNSAYQNLLHVGLLVKFPHNAHAGVVDDPVSLVDVAPTILSVLGYTVPPAMQGRDLAGPPAPRSRPIFGESFPCQVPHSATCPEGCLTRAVVSWPYKFISSSNGTSELYDLASDPGETRDLSAADGPLAEKLRAELSGWVKSMPAQPKGQLSVDPEVLQRLKSLGYVH